MDAEIQKAFDDLKAQISTQGETIAVLENRLALLENVPAAEIIDLTPINNALSEIDTRFDAVENRLTLIEEKPVSGITDYESYVLAWAGKILPVWYGSDAPGNFVGEITYSYERR